MPTIVAHRQNVTADDMIGVPAPGALSGVIVAGGALAPATSYNLCAAAETDHGPTTSSAPAALAPGGGNNAIRIPIPQVAGAQFYDVFCSVDVNPKWVTRVTEAQRAAGGIVTAVGGYAAGGVANALDIGVVGTGVANNAYPFLAAAYSALYVSAAIAAQSVITDGAESCVVLTKFSYDGRATGTTGTFPLFVLLGRNRSQPAVWHKIAQWISHGGTVGGSFSGAQVVDIRGIDEIVLLSPYRGGGSSSWSSWIQLL